MRIEGGENTPWHNIPQTTAPFPHPRRATPYTVQFCGPFEAVSECGELVTRKIGVPKRVVGLAQVDFDVDRERNAQEMLRVRSPTAIRQCGLMAVSLWPKTKRATGCRARPRIPSTITARAAKGAST